MNYVEIAFVLSLLCMAVFVITRDGMIFNIVRNWFNSFASKSVRKPFFECPPCMASVWGTTFYWIIYHNSVSEWLICILICSVFNKVIYSYVE